MDEKFPDEVFEANPNLDESFDDLDADEEVLETTENALEDNPEESDSGEFEELEDDGVLTPELDEIEDF